MIRALKENADLVDSLDVSTPEQSLAKDKLPDASWGQHKHATPRGEASSLVRGQFTAAVALSLAYMLSPLCDTHDTFEDLLGDDEDKAQTSIEQWAAGD